MTKSIDTERLAASNLLFEIASRFELEATLWHPHSCKDELIRTARLLAEHGRAVLRRDSDLEVAEAYATAGARIIDSIAMSRRYFSGSMLLATEAGLS